MILTLDIGTSFLKTALLDSTLKIIKLKSTGVDSSDYRSWISAIIQATDSFGETHIDAIGVCGHGPTLVPYSENNFFHNLTWQRMSTDGRIRTFCDFAVILKNEFSDVYEKTDFLFSCPELIIYLLTGIPHTCAPPDGLQFMYWDDRTIRENKLKKTLFPPFIKSGTVIGKTKRNNILGIKPGIPVLSACIDFMADLIGTNSLSKNKVCNRTGTAETLNIILENPVTAENMLCYKHPFNDSLFNISTRITETDKQDKINHIAHILQMPEFKSIDSITVCGGPSSDDEYNRLKSKITGKTIFRPESVHTGIKGMGILVKSVSEKINLKDLADKTVLLTEFCPCT